MIVSTHTTKMPALEGCRDTWCGRDVAIDAVGRRLLH